MNRLDLAHESNRLATRPPLATGQAVQRRGTLVLACIVGVVVLCHVCRAGEAPVVRVLSYNIHHGRGVDGRIDVARIAKLIVNSKADLVALQEVDRNVARSGHTDQANELAEQTKFEYAFGANIELQGGQYGNALLSRWPILHHENRMLPNNGGEQRGLLVADVACPLVERPLRVFVTHLDHRRDDAERMACAEQICEIITGAANQLVLLAGDLNATPDSRVLARFRQTWMLPGDQPVPTVPVDRPIRQIDYVLCHPREGWIVSELRAIDEAIASDHRPLLVTVGRR